MGGLLMVVMLTRSLGAERYGIFILLSGLEAVALQLSANATLQASMRLYSTYKNNGGIRILRLESRRLLVLFIGVGCIGLAVTVPLQIDETPFLIGSVLIAVLILDATRAYFTSMLNAMRRQRMMVFWQVTDVWLRMLGAYASVQMFAPTVLNALGGIMLGTLLTNVAFGCLMVKCGQQSLLLTKAEGEVTADELEGKVKKDLRGYTFAMLPISFFSWLSGMGDRYVIAGLLSASDVGLYAATYGIISRPYRALATFLDVYLRPRLYDAVAAGQSKAMRTIVIAWLAGVIVLGGLAGIILILLRETLLVSLFGQKFSDASSIVSWIALAYILFNVQLVFSRICHAYRMPHLVLWIQSIPAVCNILLCFLLLPRYGLIGAAQAIVASFALQAVIAGTLAWYASLNGER
jgi:O-antigen/teichoic acid export membrane protein